MAVSGRSVVQAREVADLRAALARAIEAVAAAGESTAAAELRYRSRAVLGVISVGREIDRSIVAVV